MKIENFICTVTSVTEKTLDNTDECILPGRLNIKPFPRKRVELRVLEDGWEKDERVDLIDFLSSVSVGHRLQILYVHRAMCKIYNYTTRETHIIMDVSELFPVEPTRFRLAALSAILIWILLFFWSSYYPQFGVGFTETLCVFPLAYGVGFFRNMKNRAKRNAEINRIRAESEWVFRTRR